MNWLNSYETRFKPFTKDEAWGLFRLAAIGEAFGWTLLISGILISKYLTPGSNTAVDIAGHSHGIFFLVYIMAVIVLHPSQGWSRWRTLIAGLASVPPYGSLIFEQWAAHQRRHAKLRHQLSLITYRALSI